MRAAGKGLDPFHCRYHVQRKARHGHYECPTYRAADLKPYLAASKAWVRENRGDPYVVQALAALEAMMIAAGPAEQAMYLRWKPTREKARVAFARLRDAGVRPDRLLAIHLAVSALIAEDADSARTREFRVVQVAKAAHRLASGTHKRWRVPQFNGAKSVPIEIHAYPRSAGRVLRHIGEAIEEACAMVAQSEVGHVLAIKVGRYGRHPSKLLGWVPRWKREWLKKNQAADGRR